MSDGENVLAEQLDYCAITGWKRQHRFHPVRAWRFDFAWPEAMLAVEVEGGTWARGRHTRGSGFAADCIKYNEAALLGWCVLRFTTEQVQDGTALTYIEMALGGKP
jgi:very-short-patch-repair endonuclease